jgi:hypothetical protein
VATFHAPHFCPLAISFSLLLAFIIHSALSAHRITDWVTSSPLIIMAQPFDAVEREMGISSYISTENSGFAAVLKARYSDFVVHEGVLCTLDVCFENSCCVRHHITSYSRSYLRPFVLQ